MRRPDIKTACLALAFGLALAAALAVLLTPPRATDEGPASAGPLFRARWRAQMTARPNVPCPFPGGWIVSDAAGGLTALSTDGKRLWQTSFSNEGFEAAASVAGGRAVVASLQGRVYAVSVESGSRLWARETEGRYQHAPLLGERAGEAVLWLVSQDDGSLCCLRLSDGGVVWRGEPTNRCDGAPVLWKGRLAYGNCDGAVYVFDASDGRLLGSVAIGDEDQMAGGLLASGDGRLWAGTRQGNLVSVEPVRLTLGARIRVSESETFVTPAEAFGGLVAVGTPEGEVVFCRETGGRASVNSRVRVGAEVKGLVSHAGRLFALAGGTLHVLEAPDDIGERVALGDDVFGLAAGADGALACIADQAVVCVKGGRR